MSVKIRLYQEGHERATGFQGTEWISTDPTYTDPGRYASAFVLRRVSLGTADLFERIARDTDFGELSTNELAAFEPLNGSSSAVWTDGTLKIYLTNFPHWVTTTAINGVAYTPDGSNRMEFPVEVVRWKGRVTGDVPPYVTATRLLLGNYVPSADDIGRVFYLSGFSNGANNGYTRCLGIDGAAMLMDKTFVTETGSGGSSWELRRLVVSGSTPRYFPRAEGTSISWEHYSSGGSLVAAGTLGRIVRRDPTLALFRDVQYTGVWSSGTAVLNHFTSVQAYVQGLQQRLGGTSTTFGPTTYYDYGP